MNIVTLTCIKNESDIIESLCRYTCAYADHMVIYDCKSQDNSKKIIESLINDGLPITIFDNTSFETPSKSETLDLLTQFIFTSLKADWLIPVDADEFIGHVKSISPRKALEKLDPHSKNHIPWRSYICDKKLTDDSIFLPHYFSQYRVINEEFEKALLSKEQYERYGCTHLSLNENSYTNREHHTIPYAQVKDLFYAHYPLRSEQQALIKVFLNCINYEPSPCSKPNTPFQYSDIYECIIKTGNISMSVLQNTSLSYGIKQRSVDRIDIIGRGLNTDFCKGKLELKYTQYEKDIEKTIQMLNEQALTSANNYELEIKKAFDILRKNC